MVYNLNKKLKTLTCLFTKEYKNKKFLPMNLTDSPIPNKPLKQYKCINKSFPPSINKTANITSKPFSSQDNTIDLSTT